MNTKVLGSAGERAAGTYLKAHGYELLCINYRTKVGEIDIVARQGDTVVFVEVKARSSLRFGRPAEAVNAKKQQKIIKVAQIYIQENRLFSSSFRFDVLEVLGKAGGQFSFTHIQSAFEA